MLKRLLQLTSLCTAFAVLSANAWGQELAAADDSCGSYWVYIGTLTGQGIVGARMDEATGQLTSIGLVAAMTRPTWLTVHPKLPVLYSVSDPGNTIASSLYSFAQDPVSGALTVKNTVLSGGTGATHLAADQELHSLFVANYGSGQVSWVSILGDGSLGTLLSIATDYGTGPSPRQTSPHAHSVAVDPTKRFVLTPDLGADRIFINSIDTDTDQLTPAATPFFAVAAGSGPRHGVFHPNGHFFFTTNELTAEVNSYRWLAWPGVLQQVQTLSLDPATFTGTKSGSHLAISRDGRFLYVADRGSNSLVVYAVSSRTGTLTQVQSIANTGTSPWDFTIAPSGRWLLVANNVSNTVDEFAVDPITGLLQATTVSLSTPQPSNVAFLPAQN
jgi:6-phosphogluconolactonase